jgi:hypothetical protein
MPPTRKRKKSTLATKLQLTIAILVKEGEGLLEFSNLFFGKLISHCDLLFGMKCNVLTGKCLCADFNVFAKLFSKVAGEVWILL